VPQPPDTIVLIHGLWMTPLSWEKWVEPYSARGHRVLAPAWPGLDGDVAELRRDPSPIARLSIEEIVDHYDGIVRGLASPPIVMGHSFGGLFTQLLLDRGLGAAGIAIDSAAPKGVLRLPFSTLRTAWPALRNPANRSKAIPLTPDQFRYRFTNLLDEEASRAVYERYYVPGVGRLLFQAGMANFNPRAATKVDYRNANRAPLLIVAGGDDHIAPPKVNKENFRRYRRSSAVTEYKEFPHRSHYTVGYDGWEEVADYALDWAVSHAAPATVPEPTAEGFGVTSPGGA